MVFESHAVLDSLAAPVHRAVVRAEDAVVDVPEVPGERVAAEELLAAQQAVPNYVAVGGRALDSGRRGGYVAKVGPMTTLDGLGHGKQVAETAHLLLAACRLLFYVRLIRHLFYPLCDFYKMGCDL